MTTKNHDFKFNIGETVSAHKYEFGIIKGVITGRTFLTMGTPLYWVKVSNGQEFKVPQHQIRGGTNE